MKLRWIPGGPRNEKPEAPSTPPVVDKDAAITVAPAPVPSRGTWRGGLESGFAIDAAGERHEGFTQKYRDELTYWVGLQRGDSERLFHAKFWDVFRGWQIDRLKLLVKALDLPDYAALQTWASSRVAVELGPGPFPSISLLRWRQAVAVDPLADGYFTEGLLPPECSHVVFLASPAEDVPLVSGGADILVVENCLDHVDDPPAVMKEIRRLLRPGGYVWLLVDLMDYKDHMHPNPFSEQSLRALIDASGMRVINGAVNAHKSHPNAYGEFRGLLARD